MKKVLFYHEALNANVPLSFQVIIKPVGPKCNLNCSYCYYLEKNKLYPGRTDFKMSEELLEKFIKEYIETIKVPVVNFIWHGGEPTMIGLGFFKKAITFQKKYSGNKIIENSFQTNGTRLTDDWCRFFHENNILVGISIDGPEYNHDHYRKTVQGKLTFREVMRGIELLQKYRVEFNTLSCVNAYNAGFALETYKFLKEIGSVFMQFLPIVERRINKAVINELSLVPNEFQGDAEVTEWSVNAIDYGKFLVSIFDEWVRNDVGKYYVSVFDAALANYLNLPPGICVFAERCGEGPVMEHNGDFYSCDHFVYPEYYLGNIYKKSISEIVGSASQLVFGINKRNNLPVVCLKCHFRFACNGECPKHRINRTSDGESGLNWLCEGYKMFFQYADPCLQYMANEFKARRAPSNVMTWIKDRE